MAGKVHQAYYGELRGGHDLLATSDPGAEYVQNLKWLTDRPSAGTVAWSPYLSGLPWGEFYVLMRTFPAPARMGSRGGFVFTHALFLPIQLAAEVGDMGVLLSLLEPAVPVTSDAFTLPELQPPPAGPAPEFPPDPRARAAVRALLNRPMGGRPVVWLGQEGFDALIKRLWAGLWPEARVALSFRVSLDPADAERGHPMLVATPLVARTRWTGFPVVDVAEAVESPTQAELLLSGETSTLRPHLVEFGVHSGDLSSARQVEAAVGLLERVETLVPDESRLLVRVLAAINDDAETGAAAKTRGLNRLASHVPAGDASFVATLRNLPAQPFPKRLDVVAYALTEWVSIHFLCEPQVIAGWITTEAAEDWWLAAVRKGLEKAIQKWRAGTAEATWRGIRANPAAAAKVLDLVPESADSGSPWADLAARCPDELPRELAESVAESRPGHESVELFAAAIDAGWGTGAAVDRLLKAEWSATATRGWSILVERHGPSKIVSLAVARTSEALFAFTAVLVAEEPSLRRPLDPRVAGWRKLWLRSITAGAHAWKGIPRPGRVRDTLIDVALDGEPVDPALLEHVAQTEWGDLRSYPRQAEVWTNPTFPGRAEFLNQTGVAWVGAFAADPDNTPFPHDAVLENVRSRVRTLYMPGGAFAGSLPTAIAAFERIPFWEEQHLLEWLNGNRSRLALLTTRDGLRLGRLVARKQWSRAARALFGERRSSAGMRTAIAECSSLLGILDQFRLHIESPAGGRLDSTAWYAAFFEFVVEHYQRGPEDDRIWQRAGGSLAHISGWSPREKWSSALGLLQSGRLSDVTTYGLLREMRRDFPVNPDLQLLDEAFRKPF